MTPHQLKDSNFPYIVNIDKVHYLKLDKIDILGQDVHNLHRKFDHHLDCSIIGKLDILYHHLDLEFCS